MFENTELADAESVRTRAAALVERHAARLGMDHFAAGLLVNAIKALPLTDLTSNGIDWVSTKGRNPGLLGGTFVIARYDGETREEVEAHKNGYGEPADAVRWSSVSEYRRKHPLASAA